MSPPRIESDRLILRAIRASDIEPMIEFFADPVSASYGGPCDRNEAFRKLAALAGHWALRGFGPWALERKDNAAFIGVSGPYFPEGWFEPEITWALLPEHHGHGFATEAADRSLRAAYEDFGWTTAVSVIILGNTPSEAVAQRIGATFEQEIEFGNGRANVWRHRPPAAGR